MKFKLVYIMLVNSNMLPLGTKAPDFSLLNVQSGEFQKLDALTGARGTVVMFICQHCPYVQYLESQIVDVANKYLTQHVHFIAISSNDADAYPADAPGNLARQAQEANFGFPYLYDETQAVAKLYSAACTPDFYLFDAQLSCVYRGRFDAATPGNGLPATGEDLCAAMDALLTEKPINPEQYPSMGCSIKWRN